jgi:hypothetical protein
MLTLERDTAEMALGHIFKCRRFQPSKLGEDKQVQSRHTIYDVQMGENEGISVFLPLMA